MFNALNAYDVILQAHRIEVQTESLDNKFFSAWTQILQKERHYNNRIGGHRQDAFTKQKKKKNEDIW